VSFEYFHMQPEEFPRPDGLVERQVCGDARMRPGAPLCWNDLFFAETAPKGTVQAGPRPVQPTAQPTAQPAADQQPQPGQPAPPAQPKPQATAAPPPAQPKPQATAAPPPAQQKPQPTPAPQPPAQPKPQQPTPRPR
jgi:hypothetical protein